MAAVICMLQLLTEVVVAGEGIAVGTSHCDNGLAEIFILPACDDSHDTM